MKKTFFAEEYVTPTLEVVSTTVEAGFQYSSVESSIVDVTETSYDFSDR